MQAYPRLEMLPVFLHIQEYVRTKCSLKGENKMKKLKLLLNHRTKSAAVPTNEAYLQNRIPWTGPVSSDSLAEDLSVLIRDRKESRPHRGRCPRCEQRTKVNVRFPYCMECNWDSLKDPSWGHDE